MLSVVVIPAEIVESDLAARQHVAQSRQRSTYGISLPGAPIRHGCASTSVSSAVSWMLLIGYWVMGKHFLRPLLGHGQKPLRPVLGHGQTASSSFAGSWANTLFVLCWVMGKHPLRPLLGHGQTPAGSWANALFVLCWVMDKHPLRPLLSQVAQV